MTTRCILSMLLAIITINCNAFELKKGQRVVIDCDTVGTAPVVASALAMLSDDCMKVLSAKVVVGTDGQIVLRRDAAALDFRKEAFRIEATDRRLLVTGSDDHGLAYGLLEISRLMGVSPWEWWADATPTARQSFRLNDGFVSEQAPSVAFRGIFINDEDWGLLPWANGGSLSASKSGVIGPETYERVFQLLLRLRANTCWPAMHECTQPFFLTEGNRQMALRYGIYIGGSHCEPMASSTAGEWPRRGNGDYDYVNNSEHVRQFWEERVREVAGQPILYTIGMRGVHDGAMNGAKTVDEQKAVLERVFRDQRAMLSKYVNSNAPQVFIPYKEVQDVYDAGLDVPDDVCLMWCDDNYGYIRHFPTSSERQRRGGNGIYYHVSYWGRPHDYLWLGTFSPALLLQQMTTAYDEGIRKIWILNVGDIKPAEYQIELFMDMAWDIDAVRRQGYASHLSAFLRREFGDKAAKALVPVMMEHYRLAFIHKPEFLGGTRTEERDRQYWNTIRDLPWSASYIDQRLSDYQRLEDAVEAVAISSPAFFQLVKYPIQAAAEMNKKMLLAQLARHGRADWTATQAAYDSIVSLTQTYNALCGGKWKGIMDHQPRKLPVFEPTVPPSSSHEAYSFLHAPQESSIVLNASAAMGNSIPCEGLGYEGKAALVKKGQTVCFELEDINCDSVDIDVRLLPSHAIEGTTLRFQIALDEEKSDVADYETHGRSEEWKENVLWNQAVRRFRLHVGKGPRHRLSFTALDRGIVLDQIMVHPYHNRVATIQ